MRYLELIKEKWFLEEPAFFAMLVRQRVMENARMACALRVGKGRLEYNPLVLEKKTYGQTEDLLRVEMIRLYLNHPYERRPEGCSGEVISVASNITIGDGYCFLRKDKSELRSGRLPVETPEAYHLPLGQCYEWYARELQGTGESSESSESRDSSETRALRDLSGQWEENELERERVRDLIDRTTEWGTMPGEMVEQIRLAAHPRKSPLERLRQFRERVTSTHRELTRMRPSRRTGGTALTDGNAYWQMGSRRKLRAKVLIAVDVSGSVRSERLSEWFGWIDRLFRVGDYTLDLVTFDAALGEIRELGNKEIRK